MKSSQPNRREMTWSSLGVPAGLTAWSVCTTSAYKGSSDKDILARRFHVAICAWTLGKMSDPAVFAAAQRLGVRPRGF